MTVLNSGRIFVDGRVIKSPRFPVGMMDVVSIPSIGKAFRIVPHKGGLVPVEIGLEEKDLKICVVKDKRTVRGSKYACTLHDGRVIFPEAEVGIGCGDSCIVRVPDQQFQASFRLTKGSLALLTHGERSGEVVTVEDMKPGTFSRGSIASIRLADGTSSELPATALMPLGKQLPTLTLSRAGAV